MSTTTLPDMFEASGRGLQHHGLRRANERAVLTVIGFNPGVSNAGIARLSGLAPQTVSAILGDLDNAGLIARGEVLRGRRGQPATPIFLRATGAYAIGVELSWRHIEVLLIDFHGEVLARRYRDYAAPDAATLFAEIGALVETVVTALAEPERQRIVGIGVAMPSTLGWERPEGEAGNPWGRHEVAAHLKRVTGRNAFVFNDGNAACWAELIAFPRPRPSSFIYFLISRYIAAGIVGEGTLWEGPTGNSANLGSMLVPDEAGAYRPAHEVASIAALCEHLAAAGIAADAKSLEQWDWQSFGPVLDEWIATSARALAHVAHNTEAVIESGLVVLDGVMPDWVVHLLVDAVIAELALLPLNSYGPIRVVPGHMGGLAPAVGASELVLYRRYFSRALTDISG